MSDDELEADLAELMADAQLMIEIVRDAKSPIFRKGAALSLSKLAVEIHDTLKAQEEDAA